MATWAETDGVVDELADGVVLAVLLDVAVLGVAAAGPAVRPALLWLGVVELELVGVGLGDGDAVPAAWASTARPRVSNADAASAVMVAESRTGISLK